MLDNTLIYPDIDLLVSLPDGFDAAASRAALRLAYLHPDGSFAAHGGGIHVSGRISVDIQTVRRDVLHMVYREKIYLETLAMRSAFYETVLRSCPSGH